MEIDVMEVLSRHIPILSEGCVEKLRESTVLVVGVGGLGSAVATYLSRAGVGKLILVDEGIVEPSNLNRQILYGARDVGKPKALVAKERIEELAPWCRVEAFAERFSAEKHRELVRVADIVVDALDNWGSRRELNRVCLEEAKPLVHGGVEKWYGQVTTVIPCVTPCIDCFAPRKEVSGGVPVLPQIAGVVGLIQSLEVIKLLCGWGTPLIGKMLVVDLARSEFDVVKISRNPSCPTCSRLCPSRG